VKKGQDQPLVEAFAQSGGTPELRTEAQAIQKRALETRQAEAGIVRALRPVKSGEDEMKAAAKSFIDKREQGQSATAFEREAYDKIYGGDPVAQMQMRLWEKAYAAWLSPAGGFGVGEAPKISAFRGEAEKILNTQSAPQSTDELPDPAQYSGKIARDTETGKRYQSDGQQWTEIP
jgi:hypothetical protein